MIFAILVLAFLVRLISLNQSLWLDEAIGAIAVRDFSFLKILTDFPKFDNHPPLYYLALKLWTGIFGYSEVSIRFPSVIFGTLTVYVTFLIAQILVKKKKEFAYLTALLLAVSPFHIYYSQEARMYSLAGFLAALSIYSLLKPKWLIFSFSLVLLIFTDYMPVFLIPVFFLYGVLQKKDKFWWKRLVFSHIPLLILGLLWLPIFNIQRQSGRWLLEVLPGWALVAGGANLKQLALFWMKFTLGRISLTNKSLYYLLISVAAVPYLYALLFSFKNRKLINIAWIWLITPVVLGFVGSLFFPAFTYFRYVYVVPAFCLVVAWGILNIKYFKKLTLTLILLFSLLGQVIYITDSKQQREQWRQAVNFIESRLGDKEIVLFEFSDPPAGYRWYEKRNVEVLGATDSISANEELTTEKTEKALTSNVKGVYHFEYLRDLSDPNRYVERTLGQKGFTEVKVYNQFVGIGEITYWKRP